MPQACREAHRKMTTSSSPGSFMYSGSDRVERTEFGRARRVLAGRPVAAVVARPWLPRMLPASCSAVSSVGCDPVAVTAPDASAALALHEENLLRRPRLPQMNMTPTRTTTTTTRTGTCRRNALCSSHDRTARVCTHIYRGRRGRVASSARECWRGRRRCA